MKGELVLSTPRLTAAAKPALRASATWETPSRDSSSIEPSLEPLSTTITSTSTACSESDRRQRSMYPAVFQLGMIAATVLMLADARALMRRSRAASQPQQIQ